FRWKYKLMINIITNTMITLKTVRRSFPPSKNLSFIVKVRFFLKFNMFYITIHIISFKHYVFEVKQLVLFINFSTI
ncbi:hypothetical protein, partial [Heyndrickxia sporothermodurans]